MRWTKLLPLTGPLLAITLVAPPADAAPAGRFDWPLHPRPPVLRRFDKPPRDWLPGHRGVDLGGAAGQSVLAAGDGVTIFADEVGGKPVVSIDHPSGLRTTYEPVRAAVPEGRRVRRGEVVGSLEPGHPGCPGVCLHWGLRRGHDYLDPLGALRTAPLRLKPLTPAPPEAKQ
ncbi:M23 family metallopeptidase [Nocardia sp. NPDC004068]|uniref:M23 family metallopeptidase n=1 Tax=Nocardia sp. NPDC004068 TaxID=3364303 RepID=UPI003683964C